MKTTDIRIKQDLLSGLIRKFEKDKSVYEKQSKCLRESLPYLYPEIYGHYCVDLLQRFDGIICAYEEIMRYLKQQSGGTHAGNHTK